MFKIDVIIYIWGNSKSNYKELFDIIYIKWYNLFLYDKKYRVDISKSFLDARKYPVILFVLAKMMEMNEGEKNQVIMWFVNNI